MSIECLFTLFMFIIIICFTLMICNVSELFLIPTVFSVAFACSLYLILPSELKSESIIEEYLRSSYSSTIDENDISNILKSYDNAELLNIDIYKIPKSNSKFVKLYVRIGNFIYRDLEFEYTIGINYNKVYVKKGD